MKKVTLILLFLAGMAMVFSTWAQDDPSKAAQLLNVPNEFVKYNGQIQKKIQYEIIETRTTDYTNVDTINGKLVKVVEVKSKFESVPVIQSFGYYGLNMVSDYINAWSLTPTSDSTLYQPSSVKTVTVGPFAGYTYLYGWQSVLISKASGGYNYSVTSYPYMNTESDGKPAINPWLSVKLINVTRTGSVSISQARFQVNITNVRETKSKATTARYTKTQFESLSKWDEEKIADAKKTIFQIFTTSGNTHINSLASDIVPNGTKLKGQIYINGIISTDIPYTTLTASMGLKFPQVVQRWHLYNGEVNNSVYGSTWTKQLSANEPNDINVVAGTSFNFNEATMTLTYDASKPAELWYAYECLPAQGKNEGHQTRLDLRTGLKK